MASSRDLRGSRPVPSPTSLMNATRVALTASILALLGACNGGGGSPRRTLLVGTVASSLQEGTVLAPITVSVVDGSNNVVASDNPTVTIALANTGLGATLGGTLSVTAVAGVATFGNLTLTGEGSGLSFVATASGLTAGTSTSFTVLALPTQLVITSPAPSGPAPFTAFDVTVELRSARNTLVTTATDTVTLGTAALPDLLWHASGTVTELVEVTTGAAVIKTLPSVLTTEKFSAVYDEDIGLLRVSDINSRFCIANPGSGDICAYRNAATGSADFRGMTFDGNGVMYTVLNTSLNLRTIDLFSGVDSAAAVPTISMSGFTPTAVPGMASQPGTGFVHAIVRQTGSGPRRLARMDLATAVLTDVGDLGDAFASLTFCPDGTLYGVTGNGAAVAETLYTIDPTTGTPTLVGALGNGADGEIIAYVPRTVRGTTSVAAVGGIATFTGVYFDQPGTGYVVTAAASGATSASLASVDVSGAVTPTSTVSFVASTSTVAENVAGGIAEITLQLSVAETHVVPVMISIDGSSTAAIGGSTPDATKAGAFQVLIPAGATTATFQVPIVDDTTAETDETLVFTIRSAVLAAAVGGTATHTLTIQSNE